MENLFCHHTFLGFPTYFIIGKLKKSSIDYNKIIDFNIVSTICLLIYIIKLKGFKDCIISVDSYFYIHKCIYKSLYKRL